MSLLTIAQAVSDFVGFERPTTVAGNTDPIARQLLVMINREGAQLMRANNWPIGLYQARLTTAQTWMQWLARSHRKHTRLTALARSLAALFSAFV